MEDVVYLEVGDRLPGDSGSYPDDDLKAVMGADGKWQFQHKDGASILVASIPNKQLELSLCVSGETFEI